MNKQLEKSLKENISKMRDIEEDLNKTKIFLDNEILTNRKLNKTVISMKDKFDYEKISNNITIELKNQSIKFNENNQKQINKTLNENSQNNKTIDLNDDEKLHQNTTRHYFKPKKHKPVKYDTVPKASFCIIHIIIQVLIIQDNIFINRNNIYFISTIIIPYLSICFSFFVMALHQCILNHLYMFYLFVHSQFYLELLQKN